MSVLIEEITQAALSLPVDQRAVLADRLVDSLNTANDGKSNREAWVTEVRRRVHEIVSGEVELIDGPAGLARIRQTLRR